MSYNLEDCENAKNKLLELGVNEDKFYPADKLDSECDYLLGEPMIETNDNFLLSARESYVQYLQNKRIEEDTDYYINMMLGENIK